MITIIVCSNSDPQWTLHERNCAKTVGSPFEYLRIDNRFGGKGICSAYNSGVEKSSGDILVFVHEDVFFIEPGWGKALENKFAENASLGLVGVAGTQYLFSHTASWAAAGRPFIRGRIINEFNNEFFMTVFNRDKSDAAVVAVDGLFFAIRRSLFNTIRFDQKTFDGFHFYDLDICMQIHAAGWKQIVTWDIMCKHLSPGKIDDAWREYGSRFRLKYKDLLPVSSADMIPDPSKKPALGENFNLLGKASSEIIC